MPSVIGYGAGLAAILGTFDYSGGRLSGAPRDPNHDEYAWKDELRKNRRRPLEETIANVGEGRGRRCESAADGFTHANGNTRNLPARVRGAETRAVDCQIWSRLHRSREQQIRLFLRGSDCTIRLGESLNLVCIRITNRSVFIFRISLDDHDDGGGGGDDDDDDDAVRLNV